MLFDVTDSSKEKVIDKFVDKKLFWTDSMSTDISYNLALTRKIVEGLGYELNPDSVIMDFGCSSGKTVQELRKLGYLSLR